MNFAGVGDGTIKSKVTANDPTNFYLAIHTLFVRALMPFGSISSQNQPSSLGPSGPLWHKSPNHTFILFPPLNFNCYCGIHYYAKLTFSLFCFLDESFFDIGLLESMICQSEPFASKVVKAWLLIYCAPPQAKEQKFYTLKFCFALWCSFSFFTIL